MRQYKNNCLPMCCGCNDQKGSSEVVSWILHCVAIAEAQGITETLSPESKARLDALYKAATEDADPPFAPAAAL